MLATYDAWDAAIQRCDGTWWMMDFKGMYPPSMMTNDQHTHTHFVDTYL